MGLFELRKWYFDVITDGGDVLCAQIALGRLLAARRILLSAQLVTPEGRHVRDAVTLPGPAPNEGKAFEAGGHRLERTAAGLRLFLDLPGLQVELLYAPAGDWHPNGNRALLSLGGRSIFWEVPRFRAKVSGAIGSGRDRREARGTGYHDFVRTDIPPWKRPVRELVWGRAHFPSASLVWHQVTTREGGVLQNVLVKQEGMAPCEPVGNGAARPRPRWIDDFQFRLTDPGGPGAIVVSHPAFSLALREDRVINAGGGRDRAGLETPDRIAWPPLWRALAGTSGRPAERRAVSAATLEMGGHREQGLALHERLVWPGSAGAAKVRS